MGAIILIILLLISCLSYSKTKGQIYKERTAKILDVANGYVGKKVKWFRREGRYFRSDCSGFIQFLFNTQKVIISDPDIPLQFGTQTEGIYLFARSYYFVHKGNVPKKGDIIFFHNTFDKNGDKKVNDLFTHIAIVDSIQADGTIYYIHNINSKIGVQKDRMNLVYPNSRAKNSFLRSKKRYPHPEGKYLSGQLFASFATIKVP